MEPTERILHVAEGLAMTVGMTILWCVGFALFVAGFCGVLWVLMTTYNLFWG